nr:putative reverse transcriptase domain-containing protein [Tanacetum cinerariifolium]
IAQPLTLLTQKDKKFDWSEEQEKDFQTLKDALCSAPILALPDGPDDFVVYCEASRQGLGCRRWIELFNDYDCEIRDHPSKANVVVGALSKERIKPVHVRAMNMMICSNIKDHNVKVIRCDNRIEFKNGEMNQFYEMKRILRQFSVARTPQQNRVAERRNRTLIKAARTMLADSKTPTLSCIRPFGYLVTILNTKDHLGKFNGKADEGFFIGYSLNSKAFRVFNIRTRIMEENLHIRFSKSTSNVVGTKACDNADLKSSHDDGPSSDEGKKVNEVPGKGNKCNDQEKEDNVNSTNNVHIVSSIVNVACTNEDNELTFDPNMHALEDVGTFDFSNEYEDDDDDIVADMNNMDTTIQVSPIPTTRIHKDHPFDQLDRGYAGRASTIQVTRSIDFSGFTKWKKGYRWMSKVIFFMGRLKKTCIESIFTTGSSSVIPIPSPKSTMTPSIMTTTTTASQPPIPPTPIPNKTILDSYEESAILKRRREEDNDQEGPFAGSDRGSKRRREAGEHASASTPSEPATTSIGRSTTGTQSRQMSASESALAEEPPRKPPTPDRDLNKSLPAAQGNAQSWISALAKQTDARSSFNELLDPLIDFSNFIMNRLGVDTLTPELLAGPTYELMRGSCNSLTELEYHLEEVYKVTMDQLNWVNPEDQQYPHNLLQPLLLIPDNRGRLVISFEHFINNDLEYLRGGDSSRKYTTTVTKTKAADYGHIKWIEDLVPRTMWIQEPINYDKHAFWGVSHWGRKRQ